jgi:1-acyl-sn-glycerol-3-phosphate acyltransferase
MLRILLMVLRNFWRVPSAWFKLCSYAKRVGEYPEQESYDHIRYIMKLAVKSGNIQLKVTGLEKLPPENGFILYGNHQGMFDVVALVSAFPRILGCVFKIELANIPFLKQIIACTKSFAMDRSDVRQSLTVIQNVTKEVLSGRNYLIFPEGTRSKNGNAMGEFHGGSFRCAVKSKCPIVPVAFINSYKVLDQKGTKPVMVQMHFLDPIPYAEYGSLKTVEIAELVKSRIAAAIESNI